MQANMLVGHFVRTCDLPVEITGFTTHLDFSVYSDDIQHIFIYTGALFLAFTDTHRSLIGSEDHSRWLCQIDIDLARNTENLWVDEYYSPHS